MVKKTTTLMDYFQSELQKLGKSEFVNHGVITFSDYDYTFIRKITRYDEDVQNITNKYLFSGFTFNGNADYNFKRAFVARFINREIAFQTIEVFSGNLVSLAITNKSYIEYFFNDLDDYLTAKSTSDTTFKETQYQTQTQTNDKRSLESELPQNNINLNVDDTVLDYGNNNRIDRDKNRGNTDSERNSETKNESHNYNIDNLLKINGMMTRILDEFDQKLFSQVF